MFLSIKAWGVGMSTSFEAIYKLTITLTVFKMAVKQIPWCLVTSLAIGIEFVIPTDSF